MALKGWDEIRLIPSFSIAIAFKSRGIDLCLRYSVIRICVLRMRG
jgi:hypothetical protein